LIRLVGQDDRQLKLTIFVDGLDEFDGLDADMAKIFGAAADSQRVKVCASSRPHFVYEKAFTNRPSLRLQDLTYNDIRTYVEDRLFKDESMQYLFDREPVQARELVEEIVRKADGVFLWVYLVVSSLLRGLGNCDEFSDLKRKLQALPPDLKQLYTHIIRKVDEDYKEETVQFFQLMNATQPLDGDWKDLKPMTVLSLCLAKERDEELPNIVKTLTSQAMIHRCRDMNRRLKSRTGGLIEVQLRGVRIDKIDPSMKVGYLHRTVRDFLITREMRDILQAEIDFDPNYAMLKSSVYELQVKLDNPADRNTLYCSALTYARRTQSQGRRHTSSQTTLLDQLYTKAELSTDPRELHEIREVNTYELFLETAVGLGFIPYVREKLENNTEFPNPTAKRRLLHHSLSSESIINPSMVLTLLSLGAEPFMSDLNWKTTSSRRKQWGPSSTERFMLFKKVVQHLDQRSTLDESCSSEAGCNRMLPLWAEVMHSLLQPVTDRAIWNHASKIRDDFNNASKVISQRFEQLPLLDNELQLLLREKASQLLRAEESSDISETRRCCFQ
jgi:hypothetical protein